MFLQSARHPDPLFMTRPSPVIAGDHVPGVPIPRPRIEAPAHVAPAQPAPAAVPTEALAMDKAGIMTIQRALTTRGYYKGEPDGRTGPSR